MTVLADLPNPAHPSFVLVAGGLGAFMGATVARSRGRERDEMRRLTENWAYAFTAAGLALYLLVQI